jgi:hypothetical protein
MTATRSSSVFSTRSKEGPQGEKNPRNYAAHKHPKVMAWLDRHPRFTFHFTPTSASWLNAVEIL